ncbi:HD domain-containing phosphohydrolase [Mariprofundus ferrooxydans]|uniref:HD domain-containing phosphohydrolase n=1 Tax=Mariprofundus ferrooxydans TaxID=314344 RepID=UPI0003784EA4|nr:HD domain-containing phosphohydrolase [Mariprofundus ferrooxydans]KON47400.1 metal-dependent phosphohydrolase [Mariprofundus ferrooxydans]
MADYPFSIRLRVMLIVAFAVTGILASGYLLTRYYLQSEIQEVSYQQLNIVGESLKTMIVEMMKSGADDQALEAAYAHVAEKQPAVLSLRVLHGHAVNRQFGVHKNELAETDLERRGLESRNPLMEEQSSDGGQQTAFIYPLFAEQVCLSCHQAKIGESLGIVSLRLDSSGVHEKIEDEKTELLLLSLLETLLLLLLLLWTLNRLVFYPLVRLGEGANTMASGDLGSDIEGEARTELGVVVQSFNHMAAKIRSLLGDQEKVIEEQTLELTHLMETSQHIGSEQPLPEVLSQFSITLTDVLKVTTCRILMLDDNDTLDMTVEHPIRAISEQSPPSGNRDSCPHLWEVIRLNDYIHIHSDDPVSEAERALLRLDQAESALCMPIANKGRVFGVVVLSEFRSHERDPIDMRKIQLCRALVSQMGVAIEMAKLYERLVEQMMETVLAMAESVEKKSPWTAGHSRRVTGYAVLLAEALGWSGERLEELRIAGLLHDLGKIAVPGSILNKQGRLSEEEYNIIKRHPEDGAQILSKIRMLHPHVPIIRYHHEWFNGNGYPAGLRGDEIPIGARIMAVADAFDAMTADRPYRKGLVAEQAIMRLEEAAGTQFDPELVKVFKGCHCQL